MLFQGLSILFCSTRAPQVTLRGKQDGLRRMPWRCPLSQRGAAERSTYEHNSDLWCWVGPTAFKVKPVIFDLRILDTQSPVSLSLPFTPTIQAHTGKGRRGHYKGRVEISKRVS